MIIDMHAHVVAPPEMYAYKAGLVSHRGAHGKGSAGLTDEKLEQSAQENIRTMDSVGTDVQFISPRPFQQMHSEKPQKIVRWWIETVNDAIAWEANHHPDRLRGVCGLPTLAGESPRVAIEELERCVKGMGFIGCILNPDPGEGDWATPTLGDEYWYPLYEKLVELDVPALIHSAGCRNDRESYSEHFITEESIAILSLCHSRVFKDFPNLKIIVSHGGGSVPFQIGRWRAARFNAMRGNPELESFDESLRRLYFDTVLYNKESLDFLFRIVGTERCMFGTEKPGSGTAIDPATGKYLDDLKPVIESIDWLTEQHKKRIFEDNTKQLFTHFKAAAGASA